MRGRQLHLAALLSLAACATTKGSEADSEADDSRPVRDVVSVEVIGNARVETDDLVDGLANHPPRGIFPFTDVAEYEALALELDKRRIESVYKERGFFSARVTDAEVNKVDDDEVAIVFRVDEGAPSTLDHVEVIGAPAGEAVDAEALIEVADLRVGRPFKYDRYQRAKEKIKARLVEQGYAHAEVKGTVEVHEERETAVARFTVNPGPISYFGEVSVEGLSRTEESLVRNRIAWNEGERFDPVKLEETRGRLYETGLVGNVRFDWREEGNPRVLDIVIRAKEGTRHELRLGGGIGLEQAHYEARARAMYTHRNFLDPKATLRLNLRPGFAFFRSGLGFAGFNIEAGAELDREDFLFPRWKLTNAIDYTRTELEAFAYQGPSVRLSMGRPILDERLALSFGVQYHYYDFPRVNEAISAETKRQFGIFEPSPFASFQPSLTYDARDDPFSPAKGWYASLRLELGHIFKSDASQYGKVTPELRGYIPIQTRRVVLAGKARIGTQVLDLVPIPVTQRFFSGGAESQRGFGYRRLAPQVTGSEGEPLPLGGEVMIETSAELRVDVAKLAGQWFGFVVFLDGADVANHWSDIPFPNLHWAVGPGLRYDTPVGPVRFDIGFRLNRMGGNEPDPDSRFAFHFSLGEAF